MSAQILDPTWQSELDQRCMKVFEKVLHELGEGYHDWLVAIEPESGDYFLGQDDFDVLSRARKKHPESLFFTYRLNENPTVNYLC